MQVLNSNELNQVSGGFIPALIAVAAVVALEVYNAPPAY
ncbi:MAG: class IIb bacteriocin, lactobin A/cerein 7B family [Neisseria sp.]|nr:class IIb bacteriocin, lactobin A/cerein 7B family [Neisseria sp.]MDO4640458.1 class IIb bacteriocin, lactobin A/cerein 7B family [Neisseria sp.]